MKTKEAREGKETEEVQGLGGREGEGERRGEDKRSEGEGGREGSLIREKGEKGGERREREEWKNEKEGSQ